jgi:hypothetical protein
MISKLKDFFIPYDEYIIGTRLKKRLADQKDVGYFKTDYLTRDKTLPYRVIVTAHSDYPCDRKLYDKFSHPGLIKWFARHACYSHPKVEGVPVGHQEPITEILGNTSRLYEKSQETKKNNNLVHMNWRDSTWHERASIRNLYEKKHWITNDPYERSQAGYERYLDGIYNHKFVLCPRGNGAGSIRMWDSLVLRSIPIVKRSQAMSYFEDLPVLWVDDWDQDVLSEEYLEKEYVRIMETEYDLNKLTLSYWANRIIQTVNGSK